ncbi:Choline/ethanolamine kinase [Holothuria leucospilota]|uniref:Choline/ethanolamine kinase n=1 Tax=Holothuria leucospilota TaxID=206669 RepID=A0A9Q0YNN4_HOLLE|nr:Choline/ethanolamine kinase [Holothuria leucospilota]
MIQIINSLRRVRLRDILRKQSTFGSQLNYFFAQKMDDDVDFETKKKAFGWCREYLGGSWLEIEFKDFQIRNMHIPSSDLSTIFTGPPSQELEDLNIAGLTNYIYECSLPDKVSQLAQEPRHVLLRVFGEIFVEGDTPLLDTVIFTLLSERNHSPHLFGVFPEGRLEEFIPSRSLRTEELSQPQMSEAIARKLAVFHQLKLPLCKVPRWVDDILYRWTEAASRVTIEDVQEKELFQKMKTVDFFKEAAFLSKLVADTTSPVVFSHNDCQEGNILFLNDKSKSLEDNLVLIDYEYASYNFSAYDFANHFNEWTMDYSRSEPPYYKITKTNFPTRQEQVFFLKAYDKKLKEMGYLSDELGDYDERLREIQRFVAVNHFLWSLWSVIQAKMSKTTFGFLEYAWDRFCLYKDSIDNLPKDMLHRIKRPSS